MLNDQQKEIIEEIGVYHERKGMQPLVGRIIGMLLVVDSGEATFDEIVEELGASKSAISNALHFMQGQGRVEYRTKPGDRKRYFRLPFNNWKATIKNEFDEMFGREDWLERLVEVMGNGNPEFNEHILEFQRFHAFLRVELLRLLDKFEESERNRKQTPDA